MAITLVFCSASGATTGRLIIPGDRIGRVSIGEEGSKLSWLGQSSYDDSAMGHYWEYWHSAKTGHTLGIYTVRNDNGDDTGVRQVFTDSPYYHTRDSLHPGSSLHLILRRYPHAVKATSADDSSPTGSYAVYDDPAAGISFQIYKPTGLCTGILVHARGTPVTEEYAELPDDTRWGDPTGY